MTHLRNNIGIDLVYALVEVDEVTMSSRDAVAPPLGPFRDHRHIHLRNKSACLVRLVSRE